MDTYTKAINLASGGGEPRRSGSDIPLDLSQTTNIKVPSSLLEENKIVAGILTNPVAEYYRMLRTRILRVMSQNGWRTLGITGPSPSSGKTLTAANLAVAIAMEPNHSALLIDGDLRKTSIGELFGVSPRKGICEYMAGTASFEEVVFRPGLEKLGVIMNTRQRYGSSDLLLQRPMLELLDKVKQRRDPMIAIVDMPPVFVGDDAVALSSRLDAVLVVLDAGKVNQEQMKNTLSLLSDANVIGCVLNNAPESDCSAQQDVDYYRSLYSD